MFDLLPCGFAGFLEFVGFVEFIGFVEFTYNFSSLRTSINLGALPSYIPSCISPDGMAI